MERIRPTINRRRALRNILLFSGTVAVATIGAVLCSEMSGSGSESSSSKSMNTSNQYQQYSRITRR
jgi:hypothetical protein